MANYRDTRAILERLHAQEIDVDKAMELLGVRPKGRPAKQQKVSPPKKPTKREVNASNRMWAAAMMASYGRDAKSKERLRQTISGALNRDDRYADKAFSYFAKLEREGRLIYTRNGVPAKLFERSQGRKK